jgi:hypothetical protein
MEHHVIQPDRRSAPPPSSETRFGPPAPTGPLTGDKRKTQEAAWENEGGALDHPASVARC